MNNSALTFQRRSRILLTIMTVLEAFKLLIEWGYQFSIPLPYSIITEWFEIAFLLSYLAHFLSRFFSSRSHSKFLKAHTIDLFLIFVLLFMILNPSIMAALLVLRQVFSLFYHSAQMPLVRRFFSALATNPAQITMFSFLTLIFLGTILLMFPAATKNGLGAPPLTALFTATSATCVTGLIVVDTGSFFTPFGQIVILLLIQAGGLGIMTFSASLAIAIGRKFGVKERTTLLNIFDIADAQSLRQLVFYIIKLAFIAESIGALLLFTQFHSQYDSLYRALFSSIFHAVSAFCNAGFSLYADSLTRYQSNLLVNLTISSLIVIGGLGFAVVVNIMNQAKSQHSPRHFFQFLTAHTKIVLLATAIFIGIGTLLIFFLEFDNSMMEMPVKDKLIAAVFQSISLRTAGFNTINMTQLHQPTIFMMLIWMFIGAAPGSTGGGIKITTFSVLALTIRTLVNGRHDVEVFNRTIPQKLVYKSMGIFFIALSILALMFGFLLITESLPFKMLLFESVSAFGTVGLSLGATPLLSSLGRVIIIVLMYVGRIGPLTLAYAIGERNNQANITYPDARIMVG